MVLFDLLLLSVLVITAYLGPMIVRRLGRGQRTYGWMVIADAVCALVAFASRYTEGPNPIADTLGAVAIGAAVCLLFVPPVLRDLGRRALASDRLRLARVLSDLRELLQPGMGARVEGELIDTVLAVRTGRVDDAVDRLRERRSSAQHPLARRQLDERIIMTYLYARRWDDAIRHYQALGNGGSPQLLVEMVRAYGEVGDIDRAAALVAELEASPLAKEPVLTFLMSRARMVLLAFVGRTTAVETLLAPTGPLGVMPEPIRHFWSGIARMNAGDRSGARASLQKARRLAARDARAREAAEGALSALEERGSAEPRQVSPEVAALADRLTAAASQVRTTPPARQAPRLSGVPLTRVPVTVALIAVNLAAAVAIGLLSGSLGDLGTLIEAGANVKVATRAGEWWRLVTSMFLHVGIAHLALNMYGLWVLGKLIEQFLGSMRFFAVYMLAGLAGSIASAFTGGGAVSAGASGAVLGLLGAAIAELALHRRAYPKQWSGALLGNLLFLTAANVAIGFLYPVIDRSAHIGGLVAGGLVAALLSRQPPLGQRAWLRGVASALAAVSVGALIYGGVGLATSDVGATFASAERTEHQLGGLLVRAPVSWEKVAEHELYDPSTSLSLQLQRLPGELSLDEAMDQLLEAKRGGGAARDGFDDAREARAALPLPEPWRSSELAVAAEGMGGVQRYRLAVLGRKADGEIWLGVLYYPEALADELTVTVAETLRTIEPANPL